MAEERHDIYKLGSPMPVNGEQFKRIYTSFGGTDCRLYISPTAPALTVARVQQAYLEGLHDRRDYKEALGFKKPPVGVSGVGVRYNMTGMGTITLFETLFFDTVLSRGPRAKDAKGSILIEAKTENGDALFLLLPGIQLQHLDTGVCIDDLAVEERSEFSFKAEEPFGWQPLTPKKE